MIGNVEAKIYAEASTSAYDKSRQDKIGTTEAATVSSSGGMSKAKFVRSAAGKTTRPESIGSTLSVEGAKLQTITLHYCTVCTRTDACGWCSTEAGQCLGGLEDDESTQKATDTFSQYQNW